MRIKYQTKMFFCENCDFFQIRLRPYVFFFNFVIFPISKRARSPPESTSFFFFLLNLQNVQTLSFASTVDIIWNYAQTANDILMVTSPYYFANRQINCYFTPQSSS